MRALLLLLMSTIITPGQPGPMQPGEYRPAGQPNVVSWQLKRLAPPSQLYVGVDDVLRVAAASSQANEVVTVNYRLLRAADAKPVVGQFTVAPGSNRAVATQDKQLAEGFLLSASCQAAVATTRGQTFARLMLNPKALGPGQPAQMLMADYVTTGMAPGYPNGRIIAPTEGPGRLYTVVSPGPTGTVPQRIAVPTNARWRVEGVSFLVTTGNAVANRFPEMWFDSNGGAVIYFFANTAQTASGAITYSWGPDLSYQPNAGLGLFTAPLGPAVYLNGNNGDGVNFQVISLQNGDSVSQMVVWAEEWLDNV